MNKNLPITEYTTIPKYVTETRTDWCVSYSNVEGETVFEMTFDDRSEWLSDVYDLYDVTVSAPFMVETAVSFEHVMLTPPAGVAGGKVYRYVVLDGEPVGVIECHHMWWNLMRVMLHQAF